MLATFIMYLSEFKNDCCSTYATVPGQQNQILALFEEKIKGIFTFDECLVLGRLIRDEWEKCNSTSFVPDSEGQKLERMQTECLKIRSENRDLRSQVTTLKEEVQRTNTLVNSLGVKISTMLDLFSKRGGNASVPTPVKLSSKRLYLEECSSSPVLNKRVRSEDSFTQAVDKLTVDVPSVPGTFVHQFGVDVSIFLFFNLLEFSWGDRSIRKRIDHF